MTKRETLISWLETEIAAGRIPPGAELPTGHELAADGRWGSIATIRLAITELADRGVIEGGGPGQRWRVPARSPLPVHVARDATRVHAGQQPAGWGDSSWAHDVTAAGHVPDERIRAYEVSPGDAPEAARQLGWTGPDVTLLAREVLRLIDGQPDHLVTYLFPPPVAYDGPALHDNATIPQGSLGYLAAIGYRAVRFALRFRARMPQDPEGVLLEMSRGPVLQVQRTGYGENGQPVYWASEVYPGNRVELIGDF